MKWWKIWVPLALIAAVAYFSFQRLEVSVVTAPAVKGTAVDAVTGTLKILSYADTYVKTEREGRLVEIPVKVNDVVKKGDLIAVLESRDLELQLEQEKVRLKAAEERLKLPLSSQFDVENLSKEIESLKLQVELGQISRSRLEEAERNLSKLNAARELERIQREEAVGVLKAGVDKLELQMEKCSVLAPFDGEIAEVFAFLGDKLGGNANVVRLVSPGRYGELTLSEEDVGGVAKGQKATVRLASYGAREFSGTVSWLFPTADSSNKTRKLTLNIEAEPGELVPGLTGEASLIKAERENAVLIPRRALVGNRVFVVSDGTIEVRKVTPGFLLLHRAEILDGIREGDIVILEDQDLLSDGQKVSVAVPEK